MARIDLAMLTCLAAAVAAWTRWPVASVVTVDIAVPACLAGLAIFRRRSR